MSRVLLISRTRPSRSVSRNGTPAISVTLRHGANGWPGTARGGVWTQRCTLSIGPGSFAAKRQAGGTVCVFMAVANAKTVAAVERLARADRRLAATTDRWDAVPCLLNTPAGILDLRTGATRPARIDDYATKIIGTPP